MPAALAMPALVPARPASLYLGYRCMAGLSGTAGLSSMAGMSGMADNSSSLDKIVKDLLRHITVLSNLLVQKPGSAISDIIVYVILYERVSVSFVVICLPFRA